MPRAPKKTRQCTACEAVPLTVDTSESEDSKYDSEAELLFLDGKDVLLDRTTEEVSSEDSDYEPEVKRDITPPPTAASLSAREQAKKARGETPRATVPPPSPTAQGERWRTPDEVDTVPVPLLFQPAREPGPQPRSRRAATPLDFFRLFFSDLVMSTLLANMNDHGAQQRQTWTVLTMPDLCSFLAMVIYMGLVKLPEVVDYWRQHRLFNLSFPASVISRNKFHLMCRSLHLCPLEEDVQNQAAKGTPAFDRLGKIKPLYQQIVEACKEHFHPGQNVSVDERMVASKARTGLKQYMKNKPTKWGYKLFVLTDSETGYTWNFFVYEGRASNSGKGLGYDSVMFLMDFEKLGTGYHLYVDNFYTSPHLFKDLLAQKTGACGTVRANRAGLPKTTINDIGRSDPQGSVRWIRNNELLFVKWKDTREVIMCSTIHTVMSGDTVNRRTKDQGVWSAVNVPVPAAVKDYNCHMGRVDLSDALIGYYTVLHKTRKWYRTLFYHFLDIAVVNAFILYRSQHKDSKLTQRDFREALVEELSNSGSPSTSTNRPTSGPTTTTHKLIYFTEGQNIPKEQSASAGRRLCKLCHKKTPVGCESCDVPLCFVPSRNCYRKWHDQKEL